MSLPPQQRLPSRRKKPKSLSLSTRVRILMLISSLSLLPPLAVVLLSLQALEETLDRLDDQIEADTSDQTEEVVERIDQLRGRIFRDSLSLLILGLTALGILVWIAPRRLLSPIPLLRRGLQQAEWGDLSARIGMERKDELGYMVDGFNRAMTRLQFLDRLKADRIMTETSRVSLLLEHVPEGVALADPDHMIVLMTNHRLLELAGRDLAGLAIHEWLELEQDGHTYGILRRAALAQNDQSSYQGWLESGLHPPIPVVVGLETGSGFAGKATTIALFISPAPKDNG